MANILYLVHRLPYPPDKGDKVRSYHLLRHLVAHHRVFLGTFVDDPDDQRHLPAVRELCAEVCAPQLDPRWSRVRSLLGLARQEPLTLTYYRQSEMAAWVTDVCKRHAIDCTLVFSSSMVQYAEGVPGPRLVDFVDVDSAKWTDYASARPWPLSWLYGREGRELLAYERRAALEATRSFFSTEKETQLFARLAPETASRIEALSNGVDADFFDTRPGVVSPYAADELPVVFTGAMDYWPNVDAVNWFARDLLPQVRERHPKVRFHIVGRSPGPKVMELAGDAVSVSGTVPDVRPYLQHAAVVVAPLRLARGIQNKVLEAMAMGRPVVAASACAEAIDAQVGRDLLAAGTAEDFIAAVSQLLDDPLRAAEVGAAGRRCVQDGYAWAARLRVLDRHLSPNPEAEQVAVP